MHKKIYFLILNVLMAVFIANVEAAEYVGMEGLHISAGDASKTY